MVKCPARMRTHVQTKTANRSWARVRSGFLFLHAGASLFAPPASHAKESEFVDCRIGLNGVCSRRDAEKNELKQILKCLHKEPAHRYQTANELIGELGRFLRREPVLARPVGSIEHTWRWCKRKPVAAGLIATAAWLLLTLGIGGPRISRSNRPNSPCNRCCSGRKPTRLAVRRSESEKKRMMQSPLRLQLAELRNQNVTPRTSR